MKKNLNFIYWNVNLHSYYIIIESEQAKIINFVQKTDRNAICCRNVTTGAVKQKIVKLTQDWS